MDVRGVSRYSIVNHLLNLTDNRRVAGQVFKPVDFCLLVRPERVSNVWSAYVTFRVKPIDGLPYLGPSANASLNGVAQAKSQRQWSHLIERVPAGKLQGPVTNSQRHDFSCPDKGGIEIRDVYWICWHTCRAQGVERCELHKVGSQRFLRAQAGLQNYAGESVSGLTLNTIYTFRNCGGNPLGVDQPI